MKDLEDLAEETLDEASLRKAASEEEAARKQPRITSCFAWKLKRADPPDTSAPARGAIDLTSDGEEKDDPPEAAAPPPPFSPSAYGTWVSEVMLQQTQVERVVEYWTKWMTLFPSVNALADADADAVNAVWAGLGYYSRAKRLHEGAKYLVEKHGGSVPSKLEELRAIPGVGPYTAGAVASIALGQPAALVDGNVIRVFSRLMAWQEEASSPALSKRCWALAERLVARAEQPGLFNQALMELGATICTPAAPACERCPVRAACRASQLVAKQELESVTQCPGKAAAKAPHLVSLGVCVVEDAAGRMLLARRPDKGLLAGQWELPSVVFSKAAGKTAVAKAKQKSGVPKTLPPAAAEGCIEPCSEAALKLLQEACEEKLRLAASQGVSTVPEEGCGGLSALEAMDLPPVEHVFSHERHTMHLYRAKLESGKTPSAVTACDTADLPSRPPRQALWVKPAEALELGITSGVRRILTAVFGPSLSGAPPKKAAPKLAFKRARSAAAD
eukprot:TRINITY_DN82099_c0_g1_i2.p1 TRINITY_DN82099_c0_g1~~TRINITY_DN82099_c0_g1_i2.p1  ORF type:complete len:503 (-),score=143.01 TRINITY_DN82099_c0_g1_i2:624-2132(-)